MTPEAFSRYWESRYPGTPPVGYVLREKYIDLWLRIHTLPESKRYAANDDQREEILRRHNTVLADMLGERHPFILVLTSYSETSQVVRPSTWLKDYYPDSQPFATVQMDSSADSASYWHFFMATRVWEPHVFDNLLMLIADNIVANVLFVNEDRASVYAPYDGGADIIASSPSERDNMRQTYASWLSKEPTGL